MLNWVAATGVGIRDESILLSVRAHDILRSFVEPQDFFVQSRVGVPCEDIAVKPVSWCEEHRQLLRVNSQPSVDVL